jgi:hypothetical protein
MAIQLTGSLSVSGSVLSSSPIASSSYAVTASYALNGGGGGGAAFPHTGSAIITGSLAVTGSTDFSYKKSIAEAWSTSTNLPSANIFNNSRAAGTTNAVVALSGGVYKAASSQGLEFNGSTWSTGNGLPSPASSTSNAKGPLVGTQNSSLAFGFDVYGFVGGTAFSYNGTSWSSTGHSLNTNRGCAGGFGTANSAVATGGANQYFGRCNNTEEYNGTAWSNSTALPTSFSSQGGAGTQNAGLAFGNRGAGTRTTPDGTTGVCTLEYNGSTWATSGTLTTARLHPGSTRGGSQNAALAIGGGAAYTNTTLNRCTEAYNGLTWSSAADFPANKVEVGTAGTAASNLTFGGKAPGAFSGTIHAYEYTGASEEQVSNLSTDTNGIIKMTGLGANLNFADDSAAATGGIPIGGLYHTSGTIKIRLT